MAENQFIKVGPQLSENDIQKVELRNGLEFPQSYKKHLLKYNGDSPIRPAFPGEQEEAYEAVSSLIHYFMHCIMMGKSILMTLKISTKYSKIGCLLT